MPKTGIELISTAAVATRLRVDIRTVHRMVDAGRIQPAHKLPGLRGPYLFDETEVARVEHERSTAA